MLLLLISFITGDLTILVPCVLPAIPIVFVSSVGGDVEEDTFLCRCHASSYCFGLKSAA
jgi:cytochrome c biogenesis protein CcdA